MSKIRRKEARDVTKVLPFRKAKKICEKFGFPEPRGDPEIEEKLGEEIQDFLERKKTEEVQDEHRQSTIRIVKGAIPVRPKFQSTVSKRDRRTVTTKRSASIFDLRRYDTMAKLKDIEDVQFDPTTAPVSQFILMAFLGFRDILEKCKARGAVLFNREDRQYISSNDMLLSLIEMFPEQEKRLRSGNISWGIKSVYDKIEENKYREKTPLQFLYRHDFKPKKGKRSKWGYSVHPDFLRLNLGQAIALTASQGKNTIPVIEAFRDRSDKTIAELPESPVVEEVSAEEVDLSGAATVECSTTGEVQDLMKLGILTPERIRDIEIKKTKSEQLETTVFRFHL